MAKKKTVPELTAEQPGNSELEILHVLWENGECSVRKIAERLKRQRLTWADTTIHTLLSRMRKKQLVGAEKKEGVLVFRALFDQQQLATKSVDEILDKFGSVSALPIVKALIKSQTLSDSDITELHNLVEGYTKSDRSKSRKKKS